MSLKGRLEKLEAHFVGRHRRSNPRYRRKFKRFRNKWIRRSKLPNAAKMFKGWEF